jgi:hypothetical protein
VRKAIRLLVPWFLIIGLIAPAQKPTAAFTLAIQAKQPAVEAGKPLVIVVTRKNVTKQVLDDTRTTNPMEYLTFHVSRDGMPVEETEVLKKMQGSSSGHAAVTVSSPYFASLKPGKSSRDMVEISFYYECPNREHTRSWHHRPCCAEYPIEA